MKVYEKVKCNAIQLSSNNQDEVYEVVKFIKENVCAGVFVVNDAIEIVNQIATEHGDILTNKQILNVGDWFICQQIYDFKIVKDEQFKKNFIVE